MTTDDLLNSFIAAGFDAPAKVQALLSQLSLQAQLKQTDLAIDALNAATADALKPIQDKRIDLQNARAALVVQLAK